MSSAPCETSAEARKMNADGHYINGRVFNAMADRIEALEKDCRAAVAPLLRDRLRRRPDPWRRVWICGLSDDAVMCGHF